MHIIVDGGAQSANAGLKNWGELLATLENGDGPERRVVTAVRFRGVEQPSFREAEQLAQTLADAAPIDVETSTVAELVESSAAALHSGVIVLAAFAHEPARAFRLHDIARAQTLLIELVETLRTFTTLARTVIDVRNAARPDGAGAGDAALEPLRAALESLFDATSREDWIAAADVLDSQISADLPRWLEAVCALED